MRFLLLISLLAAALPAAAQTPVPEPVMTPLVAEVLFPPQAVPGSDGKRHLVYELDRQCQPGRDGAAED